MNDSSDSWRTAGAWSALASRIHTYGGDESCLRWEWTDVMLYDCVVHFIGDARFPRTRARAAVPPEELSVVLKGSGVCARLCFFLVTRKLASPASGGLKQDKTANLAWHIIKRSHAWHMGAARGGTVFAFNLLSILQNWKVCLICDLLSSDFQRLINNRFLNLERKIFNYHMINNYKTAKYDCNPNVSYAFWFSLKYRW